MKYLNIMFKSLKTSAPLLFLCNIIYWSPLQCGRPWDKSWNWFSSLLYQNMKTGKICYILELFESTPKELWLLLWKWSNNIHETEAPRTTLSGFQRVRAFTFWSVDKRGTTEPAMAAAKNHPKSLQFIWYNCLNVIRTVISPDNKGNLEIVLKRLPFRCDLGP